MLEDSLFTKIIKGEIPCYKIYEDDKTIAFLDIHPINPGHTLVVPKAQIDHIWDMPDEDYQHLMKTAKLIGQHVRAKIGSPRVCLAVEGFRMPHTHVHLIPAYGDGDLAKGCDEDIIDHRALKEMADKLSLL